MEKIDVGIIGGSGLYNVSGLEIDREQVVETPFGAPSDAFMLSRIHGKRVAFLPRHNRNHTILPSEINFRANIFALKLMGAKYIVSASAVGSLRQDVHPTHFVFPDQFIDRTRHRKDTFFGGGMAVHVSFADPVCPYLRNILFDAAQRHGISAHMGGTYLCMEGPQFSTRAESHLYRSWKADVVGMTNLQEAKLAMEAEIPYATVAMVTDYDCWHEDEEAVNVEQVLEILKINGEAASKMIQDAVGRIDLAYENPIHSSLKYAILTQPSAIPEEAKTKLRPIIGSYVDGN